MSLSNNIFFVFKNIVKRNELFIFSSLLKERVGITTFFFRRVRITLVIEKMVENRLKWFWACSTKSRSDQVHVDLKKL